MVVDVKSNATKKDSLSGSDHDSLPYPSMPFAYTQPAELAALATLFGLNAPAADTARVLELGCGTGGNIIPLGHRFPNAHFVGLDLTQRHVDEGRQRIAALGLHNVELIQGNLIDFTAEAASFDYVICHGLFSWVSHSAQDSIFRILRDCLTPDGLATISYNVLPGWHLRQTVRDICRRYGTDNGSPYERVQKARQALNKVAQLSSKTTPYGQLLRSEAKRISQLPAGYVLGEFLAADNAPCHFRDFAARAAHHGLAYLCEGDLSSSISETLFPNVGATLTDIVGTDRIEVEQMKDFVTGRNFRRSVLTRSDIIVEYKPQTAVAQLRKLHLSADLRLASGGQGVQASIYKDGRGRVVTSKDHAVQQALSRLARAYPSTLSFDQLTEPAGTNAAMSEAIVGNAMLALVAASQANASTLPLRLGHAADEKPQAWTVARLEAEARQPWISTQRHVPIAARPVVCFLLSHLNGQNNRSDLTERLASAIRQRQFKVDELKDIEIASPAQIREVAGRYVNHTVDYLARHGLLLNPSA